MRVKWIWPLLLVLMVTVLTACSHVANSTAETTIESGAPNEDLSVRAVAAHEAGKLVIQPASHATVEQLGAPSCWGLETDLRWTGDYEAVWEPINGGEASILMTFPGQLEMIEPTDETIDLQKVTIGDTDLFAYYPRYTDCHALEAYLFGVKDGQAFPIKAEAWDGHGMMDTITQHPHYPLQVTGNELVVTGGQGAGQDFINVYHYQYDSEQQVLKLNKTDQVSPEDLMQANNP
ncbi:hypothetical protein [Paenibacillus glycanilyticus]|uniref:Lipoprotein n=1 Tax=Paenibacillus glycanilyticus TaxID=126569 RepID=A0ABQ6GNE3_9BACL|nr:hypothetical protein [Paenibacillus glycanilyticus]GLX70537.1 hypothetical protein MU1_48830 [Paenibacillus glycanilyticus]